MQREKRRTTSVGIMREEIGGFNTRSVFATQKQKETLSPQSDEEGSYGALQNLSAPKGRPSSASTSPFPSPLAAPFPSRTFQKYLFVLSVLS